MQIRFKLSPQRLTIQAPLPLVWELITSVGKGQLPGSKNKARLVERKSDNVLIAEFVTHSGKRTFTTLEEMTLHPNDHRITYRHLSGPIPYVREQIHLARTAPGQTTLLYSGRFAPGSLRGLLFAPLYIGPLFNKLAAEHLSEIKQAAEARARRTIKYRDAT